MLTKKFSGDISAWYTYAFATGGSYSHKYDQKLIVAKLEITYFHKVSQKVKITKKLNWKNDEKIHSNKIKDKSKQKPRFCSIQFKI